MHRALGDSARLRAIARAENSKKDGVPVFDTGAQGFLTARISLFSGVFGILAGCVQAVGQAPWTDCCSLWAHQMVVFCIWIAAVLLALLFAAEITEKSIVNNNNTILDSLIHFFETRLWSRCGSHADSIGLL